MARVGEAHPQAEEMNAARDAIRKTIREVFGEAALPIADDLERFVDACIEWKMNKRY